MAQIFPISLQSLIYQYLIDDTFIIINDRDLDIGKRIWFHNILKLRWIDYKDCQAFQIACFNSNLEYTDWLANKFGINVEEYDIINLFDKLCLNGNIKMANWLITKFKLKDSKYSFSIQDSACKIPWPDYGPSFWNLRNNVKHKRHKLDRPIRNIIKFQRKCGIFPPMLNHISR